MIIRLHAQQRLGKDLAARVYREFPHGSRRQSASFNAIHPPSAIKVAFFVAGSDAFEVERLIARQRIETEAGVLYIDSAEHTLPRKLEWYRRGGEISDRQWRDVRAIVRIQGDRLDLERLRRWAIHLRVTDWLDRALAK